MVPLVRQRGDGDCGVAALATLASLAYEDVYVAVARFDYLRGKSGLHNHQLVAVAAQLGLALEPTRDYDLDVDEGVLRVRWSGRRGRKNPGGHFVAVKSGLIFCPTEAAATEWRDYLERWGGRACTLLRGLS